MSKPREFVVYEVLPEQISGGKPWLGATEGDRFVEQDSWIGFQVHVIEYSAYEKLKAQLAEKDELIIGLVDYVEPYTYYACAECDPGGEMVNDGFQCHRHMGLKIKADKGSE